MSTPMPVQPAAVQPTPIPISHQNVAAPPNYYSHGGYPPVIGKDGYPVAPSQGVPAPGKKRADKKPKPGAVIGGTAAGALAGGLLLGPVGAVVGGAAGAGIGAVASKR